jgi:hypothetical protein
VIASLLLTVGRADAQTPIEQATLAADHSAGQAAATQRYQVCLSDAAAAHDASWTAECKRRSEKDRQDYDNCVSKLNLPKSYCDASYALHEAPSNCNLPASVGSVLDADLERARRRCELEKDVTSW